MNKKLIIICTIVTLLIVACIIPLILHLQNNNSTNLNKTIDDSTINQQNSTQNDDSTAESSKLTPAELSLYNKIDTSSVYLSSILYNPFEDGQGSGNSKDYNRVIISTYNIGEGEIEHFLKNDFLKTAKNTQKSALLYYFALEGKEKVIIQSTTTNYIKEGSMNFAYLDDTINGIRRYKDNLVNSSYISDKSYRNEYNIYSTNWDATNYLKLGESDNVDMITLYIDEFDQDNNVTVNMHLINPVKYGNDFESTVNSLVQNNEFKETITLLNNIENLEDINKVYGKTVNLKDTVFYEDLLSTKISDTYGLNLRNKDFFTTLDTTYIKYGSYRDDNYRTQVLFDSPINNYDVGTYDYLIENADDSFEYTDTTNNKFSYFANNTDGKVYVFKNESLVGTLVITHRGNPSTDIFGDLNYIFGIKK